MEYRPWSSNKRNLIHIIQIILTVAACFVYTFGYRTEGFNYSSSNELGLWLTNLAIIASLSVLLIHHYKRIRNIRTYFSIALVFLLYSLLFIGPVSNGYHINGRGSDDVLVHLGAVKRIISNHSLATDNWYPLIHILTAEIHFLGIELRLAVAILSLVFFFIFMLFIPLTVRTGIGSEYTLPSFVMAAVPIFNSFHTTFHPVMLSAMFLPFAIFTILKPYPRLKKQLLFLPAVSAIAFFHPSTTLLVLLPVLFLTAAFKMVNKYTAVYLISYLIVLSVAWYSRTEQWGSQARTGVTMLLGQGSSAVGQQTQQIVASDPTIVELLVGFVTRYGPVWLYGSVASLYVLYVIARIRNSEWIRFELWSVSNFLVGAVSGVVFLFVTIIGRNPIRIAKYASLFSVILVGLSYVKLIANPNPRLVKRGGAMFLALLVFSTIFVSVPNFYPEGDQFTMTENEGTHWIYRFSESDADALSLDVGDDTLQFYSAKNRRLFGALSENNPPNGLDNITKIDATYFISKSYDNYLYMNYIRNGNSDTSYYTPAELESKVANNYETDKVYSNGQYTVWKL